MDVQKPQNVQKLKNLYFSGKLIRLVSWDMTNRVSPDLVIYVQLQRPTWSMLGDTKGRISHVTFVWQEFIFT